MDSSKLHIKIDQNVFKSKTELEPVYFTKPSLVAYYERNNDSVQPAKKIFYFKNPKYPQDYPIDLNRLNNNLQIRSGFKQDLECELKYAMSAEFQKRAQNLKKTRIFIQRSVLIKLMRYHYQKDKTQYKICVCRYNGNLYMILRNINSISALELNKVKQFNQKVFTESLYYDININEPCDLNYDLIGVHRSSLGEFEVIYSGLVHGIQAEEEIKRCDDLEVLNTCRWIMTNTVWNIEKGNQHSLQLWLEAYLSQALDLYIGSYTMDFKIHECIVHKRLFELPRENKLHWKPSICTGFIHEFIQKVNQLMSDDKVNSLNTVYEFLVDTTKHNIPYEIFKDKPEKVFLTPEYMEYCKKEKETLN